nr:reverse transcriptase domain-containing protein [Marinobacter halodurans]
MSIEEFPAWVKAGHWSVVEQSIRSGDYQPAPVRRVEIDKPDGGKRQLGIPTVTDRVIQQALAQILMPLFEPGFSTDSYGFRPGRNAHQAVRRVQSVLKEGRRFTVDVDLSKFFDRVNHDLLMTHLGRKVRDKRLLGLIARYLRAGIIDNQLYLESRKGVPQGGPLSPLLANIMLDPLDKELERRDHRFARYADDFTIPGETPCAEPHAGCCGSLGVRYPWLPDYALFVVAPEPEDLHHSLVLDHLVDQTMLNIDAA